MGFFNKNKNKKSQGYNEELPESIELPNLPALPPLQQNFRYNETENESQIPQKPSMLPSFPASKSGDNFSQNIVKETVSESDYNQDSQAYNEYDIPEANKYPPIMQKPRAMEYDNFSQQKRPSTFEMSENPKLKKLGKQKEVYYQDTQMNVQQRQIKQKEPLFVKLDKVENTISALNEIKLRMSEIDSLLRNLKEIKMKEDQELREWERELETVKTRLDQIDKDLFKDIN
ncbi:MAG TPA: hypothetical protein VI815_01905 [Candidatus Nanoarchaeia archaeon]|nr:hypothetical protein [Candidatus Nanoarchaeia archaeon]